MVEYMREFLQPFRESPYKVESTSMKGQYIVTNTYSEFSEVVRAYQGVILLRKAVYYGDSFDCWRWSPITPKRLVELLGRTSPRDGE